MNVLYDLPMDLQYGEAFCSLDTLPPHLDAVPLTPFEQTFSVTEPEEEASPANQAHSGFITALVASPDSKWIASSADDGVVILWDSATLEPSRRLDALGAVPYALAFSPDSTLLACATDDGRVIIWGECDHPLTTLDGHTNSVNALAWAPDGSVLVSGGYDGSVRVWDTAKGFSEKRVLRCGADGMVMVLEFSRDGKWLVVGGTDCTARLWDAHNQFALHQEFHGHTGTVYAAAFHPWTGQIATGAEDGKVKFWSLHTGEEFNSMDGHGGVPVGSLRFLTLPGCRILVTLNNGSFVVRATGGGQPFLHVECADGTAHSVAATPDGVSIARASAGMIRMWRQCDGSLAETLYGGSAKLTHLVFTPDGSVLASGAQDGSVTLYRPKRDY